MSGCVRSSLYSQHVKRPLPAIPLEPENTQPDGNSSRRFKKHDSVPRGSSRWHSLLNKTKQLRVTSTQSEPDVREKERSEYKLYSFKSLPSLYVDGLQEKSSPQSAGCSPENTSTSSSCRLRRQSHVRRHAYPHDNHAQSTVYITEPRYRHTGEYSNSTTQLVRCFFFLSKNYRYFSIKKFKNIRLGTENV